VIEGAREITGILVEAGLRDTRCDRQFGYLLWVLMTAISPCDDLFLRR